MSFDASRALHCVATPASARHQTALDRSPFTGTREPEVVFWSRERDRVKVLVDKTFGVF